MARPELALARSPVGRRTGRTSFAPVIGTLRSIRRVALARATAPFPATSSAPSQTSSSPTSAVLAPAPAGIPAQAGNAALAPAAAPPWVASIAQWVHSVSQHTASIRLHLDPPSLGSVDALVRMDRGGITLVLTVQRPEAQQSLGQALGELRSTLEGQGFKVASLAVGVGSSGSGPGERDAPRPRTGGAFRIATEPPASPALSGVDRWV